MSGGIPNGPCSNDVDAEEVPCSIKKNRDDEPPMSTQGVVSSSETTVPSSAPSPMVVATVAVKNSADGAADSSSTVIDATATPDTAVEELHIETADGALDNSTKIDGPDIEVDVELQPDVADEPDEKNNATDIEANAVAVAETADNSESSSAAIDSEKEQKIDENDNTAGANANNDGIDDIVNEEEIESVGNVELYTEEANSEADGVDDSTLNSNEVNTEVQEESSEVSAEPSPDTVNDAVGADSTDGATVDSPGQEDSVDKEVPSQTLYTSPDSSNGEPDGSTKVLIRFDYDLTTVNDFNSGTLSVLEDKIVSDLAGIYGLFAFSKSKRMPTRRRHLRKLTVDDIIALDSNPVDVNVANTYECVDTDIDPNLTCTPMSGFMVAHLATGSDQEASKAAILSSIEQGMKTNTYVNSDIIKVSYIGTRSNREDLTTTVSYLEQKKSLSSNQSSLVIGLSVFFLGFAALVGFIALHTRKKRRRSSNDKTVSRNSIEVDEVEFAAPVVPVINNYDYNVKSKNRRSSGDDVLNSKHDTMEGRMLMLDTVVEDGSHASSIWSPSSDQANSRHYLDVSSIAAMGMASPVVLQLSESNVGTGSRDMDHDSDTAGERMENETAFKFV